jgi:hypothetical protein
VSESPRYVGRAVTALAADPDRQRWSQSSLTSGQLAVTYGFTDIDGSRPNPWKYMEDVEAGRAADPVSYRQKGNFNGWNSNRRALFLGGLGRLVWKQTRPSTRPIKCRSNRWSLLERGGRRGCLVHRADLVGIDPLKERHCLQDEGSTLKVYTGLSHGMCTINADQINSDLLSFIKA